jgi:hypothetical protein
MVKVFGVFSKFCIIDYWDRMTVLECISINRKSIHEINNANQNVMSTDDLQEFLTGTETTHTHKFLTGTETTHTQEFLTGTETTHTHEFLTGTETTHTHEFLTGIQTAHTRKKLLGMCSFSIYCMYCRLVRF